MTFLFIFLGFFVCDHSTYYYTYFLCFVNKYSLALSLILTTTTVLATRNFSEHASLWYKCVPCSIYIGDGALH
jgi:hypothetical protein